jgi:signal transduction histidine kinase
MIRRLRTAAAALRLPRRTLRTRLTLLYGTVFCACALVLALAAEIFTPNFLVSTNHIGHTQPAHHPNPGGSGGFLAGGTSTHDVSGSTTMFAIMVVLAVGAGWLIAGRVLRPLRTITATARDISASNLHQRLAFDGHDNEFTELGATLNNLFGRLETSFQAQQDFVANASHELRSPLTAGRTVLEVALADPDATPATLRSACQMALKWDDQMERLIGALLTLATSERGVERWEPFDLADTAGKAILDRHHEAERRGIRVDAALGAAPATGDPALAESLMTNLVGNAIRHNLDGGRVEISTTTTDGQAVLTVSNTGPLVPPDEVDSLFQPFRRLGTQRTSHTSGYGLGLAIVSAIVSVHGATLMPTARPEGGLDIKVSFP